MNFRTISTVISREYLTKVKKKSFLITTFVVPILFAAFFVVLEIIMLKNTNEEMKRIAVVDQSGICMPYLDSVTTKDFVDYSSANPDSLKLGLDKAGLDGMVLISPLDPSTKSTSVQIYSKTPLGLDFSSLVANKVEDAVEAYRIESYNIDNLAAIMDEISFKAPVKEYTLDDEGNESISESGIYMGISLIMGIIIFMFITMFGSSVMSSVIEEKSSRVVEVLISSAKATELMYGKIIGVALVAFTQFLLWIVLTGVIVGVFSTVSGTQMFSKQDNAAQIMDMAGGAAAVDGMNMPDMAQMAAGAEEDGMAVVFSTLANIPWATLIISFFIFFILGYLLYASLYAAIGASVENVGDSQQLQMPITIPLMIAYMVVFVAFRNPDGPIVFWTSMIPFTSPIVMLARIPYGVPFWQLAVSVVLLILTFIFIAWVSAKIYKAGILIFGKKATFADLWKWLKQN